MANEKLKQAAANKALEFIKDGMNVGIGTGSTTGYFIEALKAKAEKKNWQLRAAYSSEKSKELASSPHITPIPDSLNVDLDIYVDGADEVDTYFNMIKGGGKALLREKIVATASRNNMVVIVDESKLSPLLGKHFLPVEIVRFGYDSTIKRINDEGFQGNLRTKDGSPELTDNGNYLFDITFETPLEDPRETHYVLKEILGVVETGCFFDLASHVIVGFEDGSVKVFEGDLTHHFKSQRSA